MQETANIRPTKILWVFPEIKTGQTWIDTIPSKSVRALARQIHPLFEAANITTAVTPVTQESYLEWHQFYKKTMLSQDHEIIAKEEWYQTHKDEFPSVLLLDFLQGGQRVGASIISLDDTGTYTHHYKASDRIVIPGPDNVSLGGLIELYYLEYCFSQNPTKVTSGLSRNGFGFFNTLGYLAAKLRMGYLPEGAMNRPWDNEFPRKSEETPTAWFIQPTGQSLTLLCSPNVNSISAEIMTYLKRQGIPAQDYPSREQ